MESFSKSICVCSHLTSFPCVFLWMFRFYILHEGLPLRIDLILIFYICIPSFLNISSRGLFTPMDNLSSLSFLLTLHLLWYQYHAAFVSMAPENNLKSSVGKTPPFLVYSQDCNGYFWISHMNFFHFYKQCYWNFGEDCIESVDRLDPFRMQFLLNHVLGRTFHLSLSSSISFFSVKASSPKSFSFLDEPSFICLRAIINSGGSPPPVSLSKLSLLLY